MKAVALAALLGMAATILSRAAFAGPDQDLGDFKIFPDDNVWKWDISGYQLHPNSENFVASVGASVNLHPDFGTVWNGAPIGIPY